MSGVRPLKLLLLVLSNEVLPRTLTWLSMVCSPTCLLHADHASSCAQMATHPDKNQGAAGAHEASQRVNMVCGGAETAAHTHQRETGVGACLHDCMNKPLS